MKLKFWTKTPIIYKENHGDIYVKILKWAAKQENFTIKRLERELGIKSVYVKSWIAKEIEKETLFIKVGHKKFRGGKMLALYRLSFDARFKLLEVEELQFARANAKDARTWAIRAITVALLSLLIIMTLGILDFFVIGRVEVHNVDEIVAPIQDMNE